MPLAVPGTVVNSGSGVGPGGDFGQQGPGGPVGNEDVGSIKAWPSVSPPAGWLICDGSGQSSTLYPQLYSLIGTTFGPGNGTTTNFQLPDLRGRFILGQGQSTAAGATSHALAQMAGEETHVLTAAEGPVHNHSATSSVSDPHHSHGIYYTTCGSGSITSGLGDSVTNSGVDYGSSVAVATGIGVSTSIGNSAGGSGHNTMPPYLVLVYIIKVSPTGGPTAQAPIADPSQPGLLQKLSGNVSDYVSGTNTCTPLPSATRVFTPFTLPALGSNVTITVNDTSWMSNGMILDLLVGTNLQQVKVWSISGNQVTVTNYAGPVTGTVGQGVLVTFAAFAIAGVNQPGIVNALSGNASDYIGGDNLCHALPPGVGVTADYYDKDDFLVFLATGPVGSKLMQVSGSGGSGAVGNISATGFPGHPGVLQLAPGATANAYMRAFMACPFLCFDPAMTLTIQGVMQIPSGNAPASAANQFFFGVSNNVGPVIDASHMYCGFLGLPTSYATWGCYTRNNATVGAWPQSTIQLSDATWHLFKIVITGASPATAKFYIDNNLIATISDASLPSAATVLYVYFSNCASSTATNYSIYIDTFDILVQPGGATRFQR